MIKCVLYDRECRHCGECDLCDLNPGKICDNCGECLKTDREYNSVKIDGIILTKPHVKKHRIKKP